MASRATKKEAQNGGEKRREDLRLAAYRLFRDGSYDSTSVDDIVEAAGASKGSFYWHYASKHEVFLDIVEAWAREIMEQMYAQFLQAARAPDYLRATTEALERELRRGRVVVPLWLDMTVHARKDPKLRDALGRFYQRARLASAEILRPGLAGVLDEEGIQGVAAAVFGGYLGLMIQEMTDPEGADAGRAIQHFMALLAKWVPPGRTGTE